MLSRVNSDVIENKEIKILHVDEDSVKFRAVTKEYNIELKCLQRKDAMKML